MKRRYIGMSCLYVYTHNQSDNHSWSHTLHIELHIQFGELLRLRSKHQLDHPPLTPVWRVQLCTSDTLLARPTHHIPITALSRLHHDREVDLHITIFSNQKDSSTPTPGGIHLGGCHPHPTIRFTPLLHWGVQ